MKTFILCAGLGTRLAPFTSRIPKPCIAFFGLPILDHILFRIFQSDPAEKSALAANLHHLPERIRDYFKDHPTAAQPFFLHESGPEPYGTGGALLGIAPWLGTEDLLVVNGDVIADIDFAALRAAHAEGRRRDPNLLATFAALPKPLEGEAGILCRGEEFLGIGRAEDQARIGADALRGYACAFILSPPLLDFLAQLGRQPPFSIWDVCRKALSAGAHMQTFLHEGFVFDLGSPARLWEAHRYFLADPKEAAKLQLGELYAARGRSGNFYFESQRNPQLKIEAPAFIALSEPMQLRGAVGPWAVINLEQATPLLDQALSIRESLVFDLNSAAEHCEQAVNKAGTAVNKAGTAATSPASPISVYRKICMDGFAVDL